MRFAAIVETTPSIATGEDYLYILDPIMTWAQAEPAIGMIAANLPALRPLLEKVLNFISYLTSRNESDRSARLATSRPSHYLELGALRNKGTRKRAMRPGSWKDMPAMMHSQVWMTMRAR